MQKRVIVTGGAGFIGSHLVDKLIVQNNEVIVIDNFSTGKNLNPCAKYFEINIEDSIEHIFESIDVIFHLAALPRIQPSFKNPVKTYISNSTGTIVALEIARKYNAKFVYAGSSSAYHDTLANPYSYTKWLGEEHCKLYNKIYNVPVAIARFFNCYGPRQIEIGDMATVIGIFERQYREKKPLTITGDGKKRRDFTHVYDIVDGLIAMSKQNWNADIFDLGTGVNYSILEVAKMFKTNIEFIPERLGEANITKANIEKTKTMLNWEPKYNLLDYIKYIIL